ncbi:hypothetical protein IU459_10390 [Nocardia amamiensis]|uniref:Anti-sigma-M factor RsmA n=1 Tax=Nocardia amamiensis TaxID=404578 RepID=A0ABS0CMV8_9NOCA|nr:hypothetical protein [Nocardia amamiensis]MBF6297955.1 hypothetical protein [Nocardia amamiensis]
MATGGSRPVFTAELLADLHADNLTPDQRAQLWPEVARDPEALNFLRSLDAVSAELRNLGRDERVIHAMPADVTDRLKQFLEELDPPGKDATIPPLATAQDDTPNRSATAPPSSSPSESIGESESQPTVSEARAQLVTLAEHRHRRGRVRWPAAAVILAVTAVGGIASVLRGGDDAAPAAQPTTATDQLGGELTATAALSALGRHTVTGSLANPAALDRCVQANGLDRTVLGSTDITFRGQNAVLILLTGPRPPTITALVVGTSCGAVGPQRRAVQDIG